MNLSALKIPQFRRYLIANVIALHGLWVQRIATGWLAWELTGSASFVGLIAFLTYIPALITGPFFGVIIDRVDIRRAAMTTQSLLFTIMFSAYLLQITGYLTATVLAILAILTGLVTSAQHPVRMSITPRLVPKEHVGSVVVLNSLNFNLARVVGPAIGGALIASVSVEIALLVSALAYLPFIITISKMNPRPSGNNQTAKSLTDSFVEGVTFIITSPLIIKATLITGLFALSARGVLEVLPTIADGGFSRGASGLGILTAAAGAGALMAAMVQSLSRQPQPGKLPVTGLVAAVISQFFVVFLGLTTAWIGAIIAVAMLGFLGTLVGVSMQTSIQLQLQDHIRGRVMSLWIMISLGATAIGSLGIGALIDWLGLGLTLQGVGSASALLILLLILRK